MGLITGITGAAAGPEEQARVDALDAELRSPEPAAETTSEDSFVPSYAPIEVHIEPAREPEPEEPAGPNLRERSYSMVGRAMRFVMKRVTPVVWQGVVQKMAEHLPARIQLEPAPELQWDNASRHQQLIEDLQDQGFVDVGMFFVASMDTKMHLLVNEAYDIRAVVYEHANSGIVLDLVTLFGDGTGITYVNREDPGIEQSPLHPNVYLGDEPVFEMLDICLRERPKKARMPEPPAAAVRLMEMEYEFGSKRLRGEPINPVEIADAYLEAIEQSAAAAAVEKPSEPEVVEPAPAVVVQEQAAVVVVQEQVPAVVVQAPAVAMKEPEPAPEPEVAVKEEEPETDTPRWTGRAQPVLPPLEEAIGLAVAEQRGKSAKAGK